MSPDLANPPTQYQSDSLWSYELGSKGRYFDNRLSVNAILNVPKYSITPSIDFDTPVSDSMSAFVRAQFPYTGRARAYFDSSGLNQLFSSGYGIVNLNVGLKLDKLTVGLYAKNLLNWKNIIQYPSVNSVPEGYTVRPATVGITATWWL